MEIFNAASHGLFAILCFPCLFYIWNKYRGQIDKQITMEIFAVSALACYVLSMSHHINPLDKRLLLFDIYGIYGLILGTYTPIVYFLLKRPWKIFILTFVFGLCMMGIALQTIYGLSFIWISNTIFITAGWIVILTYRELKKSVSTSTIQLLFLGGFLYTVGAILNVGTKFVWKHEIFHVLVMAGTLTHLLFLLKVSDTIPVLKTEGININA